MESVPEADAADVQYEIAHSIVDLEACFQLVYRAYRRAGLTAVNAHQTRLTPFHLLDTTEVFATRLKQQIISTVSLVGDQPLGLPVEKMYPDEIAEFRRNGLRLAEIGSLADCRKSPKRFLATFMEMMKLVTQVAKFRGYDALIVTCHPSHAVLYQRLLPFRRYGQPTSCDYANGSPAVLLAVSFEQERGTEFYERFFGTMRSADELAKRPWCNDTRAHFEHHIRSMATPPPVWVADSATWQSAVGTSPTMT